MALVASIYKTSSDNRFPDILLLDEIDASLHPSMIKNMLSVIRDVFLINGIKVILVTHSPTTVALSDEASIFVMNKGGKNRIEKKNKKDALSILTEGFATLEQGMLLFDEITKHDITIITEGYNAPLLNMACDLYGQTNVNVITGIENASGKNQLKTLFEFFTRVPHKNKVVFVWDCDVNYHLTDSNNTYHIILEKNNCNTIIDSGIENMFSDELCINFSKKITIETSFNTTTKLEFDSSRKKEFLNFILTRNNKDDFKLFDKLIQTISQIIST